MAILLLELAIFDGAQKKKVHIGNMKKSCSIRTRDGLAVEDFRSAVKRAVDVIFINIGLAALRLSNAEAGRSKISACIFNALADRTILPRWSSRAPAIRQLIFDG